MLVKYYSNADKTMNKYYKILDRIIHTGKQQCNKKGKIRYLLNEQLTLTPSDLLDIFETHSIARKKLKDELQMFMQGEGRLRSIVRLVLLGGIIVVQSLSIVILHIWRNCLH